jgi:flagellar biosynthesis protein FlhA
VREPVYGAPARWIDANDPTLTGGETLVTPGEVLATHLLEVIKSSFPRLLGLRGLQRLLEAFAKVSSPERSLANRRLLDELIPAKVTHEALLSVLRLLLAERVSVRNLPVILETMAELREANLTPEDMAENVRQRLADQITTNFRRSDGTLPLIQLSPDWEETFERHQMEGHGAARDVALPPETLQRLAQGLVDSVGKAAEQGAHAAIVTSARRRRFIRAVMSTRGLTNPVLSYEEVGPRARPSILGSVAA